MATYLQIENLSKSFGTTELLNNVSFQLVKGQKIALIAKNGTGKTSLFNILYGKDTADSGKITFHEEIHIGFLEQDPPFDSQKTILEQVFSGNGRLLEIVARYEAALLSHDPKALELSMEEMDTHQAWNYESTIKQILSKLKLVNLDQLMSQLSGGQRKRVALASVLINNPELLILDEPTNHLDLDMIEWLEEYLSDPGITLLTVTHDRYFLDRVCNQILEIDNKKIYNYNGNFEYYLEKKAEKTESETQSVEKAKNLMRKELDWIRRQPKARGTKAKYRVDAFDDLKMKAESRKTDRQVKLQTQGSRMGSKIVDIDNISMSFAELKLISDFSYKFARFEKVGIVGANGTGKSTFLNLITQKLKPSKGNIEIGETIKIGYYSQLGIEFDDNIKVIEAAQNIADEVKISDGQSINTSQFLNRFLFPPDKQYDYVYKLSGGEKRRLYLATILMQNPNFLILDEPTNDLDIVTLCVLEEYLDEFDGCVLIVSHDRYFMDKIVDHLFVFEGNGIIKDFPGNYSEYRSYIEFQNSKETEKVKKEEPIKKQSNTPAEKRKLSFKEQREFDQLTTEIEKLENEKKELEIAICSNNLQHEQLIEKSHRISQIIELIDKKTERWLELSEMA